MKDQGKTKVQLIQELKALRNQLAEAQKTPESAARARKEDDFSDSEKRYRAIMQQASDAIFLTTLKGSIVEVNEKACTMLGYSHEELQNMNVTALIPAEDLIKDPIPVRQLCAGETVLRRRRLYCKDGSLLDVETNATIFGKNILLGVVRDISERKRAEEALKKSEELYRQLFNEDLAGNFISTPAGKLLHCNLAFARIIGCESIEEALQYDIGKTFPSKKNHQEFLELLREKKFIKNREGGLVRKDGRKIQLLSNIVGKFSENDELVEVKGHILDITKRKRAEAALQQSEAKLIEAQKVAKFGHYVFDAKTGYWTSSVGLNQVFGIDENYEKDVPGWLQLVHPDFRETMSDYLLDHVLTQHQRFDKEYKIIDQKTGDEKWVHGLGALKFDDNNNPVEMFGTIQDISKRKQAEMALQRFRTILDQAGECIFIADPEDGRFIDVNKNACKMLQYSRDEILNLTIKDIQLTLPIHTPEQWRSFVNKVKTSREPMFLEGTHGCKDGSTYPVSLSCSHQNFGEQDYLLYIGRDITDRKQAEHALRKSEERLRLILDTIGGGGWDWNVATGEVFFTDSWLESLGYKRKDVSPHIDFWKSIVHPDDLSDTLKTVEAHFEGKIPLYIKENRLRMKNGKYRHNRDRGMVVLRDAKGKPLRMVGTDTDITKHKRAEQALQESEQRYRAIVEDQTELISRFKQGGVLTFVNQAHCRYFSMQPEELIGTTFMRFVHEDDRQRCHLHLESLNRQNPVGTIEHRVILHSGEIRCMRWSNRAIFDGHGDLVEFQAVGRDITERRRMKIALQKAHDELELRVKERTKQLTKANKNLKQEIGERKKAEKTLQQKEEQLLMITDNVPALISYVDSEQRYRFVNRGYEEWFGMNRKELIGRRVKDVLGARTYNSIKKNLLMVLSGEQVSFEEELSLDPNESLWVIATFVPDFDKKGRVKGFYALITDITEYKKTKQELWESEETVRALLNASPDTALLIDTQGRLLAANETQAKRYYNPLDKFLGASTFEMMPSELARERRAKIAQVVRSGRPVRFQDEHDEIVLDNQISPVFDMGGKVTRLAIYSHDITELKQTEEALRESVRRYRQLFEDSPVALWEEDFSEVITHFNKLKGNGTHDFRKYFDKKPERLKVCAKKVRLLEVNKAALKLHQASSKEELLANLESTFSEESYEVFKQELIALAGGANRFESDAVVRTISGELRYIYLSLDVEQTEEGRNNYSRVLVVTSDITEHRNAEVALKLELENRVKERTAELAEINESLKIEIAERELVEKALRESEEKIRCIVNTIVDGIITTDEQGCIESLNPAAEKIFGYTAAEVVGENVKILMPESYHSKHDSHIINYLNTDKNKVIGVGREVAGKRKDGHTFPIDLALGEVFLSNRRILTGIVRDITERKQAEKRIRDSLEEKELLLKEIHHRVKNNLQVISSLLSLQAKSVKNKQVYEILKGSQDRVQSMALIHEKLYHSADLTSINFGDYLKSLTASLFHSYADNSGNTEILIDAKDISIDISKAMTCGLIINELVSNSYKHAFPNRRKGEIRIEIQIEPDDQYIMSVRDNGVGLPTDLDFHKAESLGLRLVHMFVKQLKGEIAIQRQNGTGYEITFAV